MAAQRECLEADRGAFLQHIDAVRGELTAVHAQLRDREAAAAAAQARAEAAAEEAETRAAEAAAERSASLTHAH